MYASSFRFGLYTSLVSFFLSLVLGSCTDRQTEATYKKQASLQASPSILCLSWDLYPLG